MPKSKITKSTQFQSRPAGSNPDAHRAPVKINADGTPLWFKILMFGFMLAGLAWLVVQYLAGPQIPFMAELGPWNYAVGFGLFLVGLLMTIGWK